MHVPIAILELTRMSSVKTAVKIVNRGPLLPITDRNLVLPVKQVILKGMFKRVNLSVNFQCTSVWFYSVYTLPFRSITGNHLV